MLKVLTVLTSLLANCAVAAESPQVLKEFFGHGGIADKAATYSGEMLELYADQPTLGEGLPPHVSATYRALIRDEATAVYAVLLSDGHTSQDWYAFLTRENGHWKLNAVRSLSLTGVVYRALDELSGRKDRSQEEEWELKKLQLTVSSDESLKSYLLDNLSKFNAAATELLSGNHEDASSAARVLHVSSISNDSGGIRFEIGGVLDNTVGFLFIPGGRRPPVMTPTGFIYIEEVADGWFIYKTT